MLETMKSLVCKKNLCVLATTDNHAPHCSLMVYLADESNERLFLVTPRTSRKFRNIQNNPRVSLLIDTRDDRQHDATSALTITGTCEILPSGEKSEQMKVAFAKQYPHMADFVHKSDVAVVCVQIESFLLLEGPEHAHYETLG